jgi:hypothetical protein
MSMHRLIRFVEDGIASLMDLRPHTPTSREAALARRLATDLRAIAEADETGTGSDFWRATCRALVTLATENDPLFFMRWEPIRATMVHGATPWIIASWWRLRHSADWRAKWAPALRHKQYGHAPPFPPMPATNAIAIEHASHLFHFREATGEAFHDAQCVVEFGGGYGSMCRLIHALGFRGSYFIFDLPHVLALQRYYLALHGIDTETNSVNPASGVRLVADLDTLTHLIDNITAPHFSAISTWALSEMPLSLRKRIEPILQRSGCRKILLSYQARFEGNDNRAYFTALASRASASVKWMDIPVGERSAPTSPFASFYLFGMRR